MRDDGRVTPPPEAGHRLTEQDRRSDRPAGTRTFNHMAVTVSTMFIPVHDPDEALTFYRDALGLEVSNDVARGDFRWVTVGAPDQDVDIVLFQPHGGLSESEGDALLSLVTKGSLQVAIFRTDDLDTTFEKVRASGRARCCRSPLSSPGARATVRSAIRRATSCGSRKPDLRACGRPSRSDPRPGRA